MSQTIISCLSLWLPHQNRNKQSEIGDECYSGSLKTLGSHSHHGDVAQPHWLCVLGVKKKPHPVPMWGHNKCLVVAAMRRWCSVSRSSSCCVKLVGVADNHVHMWKQCVGTHKDLGLRRSLSLMEVVWVPEFFIDDCSREEEFVAGKYCVWVHTPTDFVKYEIEEVGILANVDMCEGATV